MNIRIKIYTVFLLFIPLGVFSQSDIPLSDTIYLTMQHVEGRWIEENPLGQNDIYVFRNDSNFFKAVDNQELLIFNVSGRFGLNNDSIKVVYQDMSRVNVARPKVRTMHLRVIALSDDELNVYKTDKNETSFMRLKRQVIR